MFNKNILPPTYLFLSLAVIVALHILFPVAKVVAYPWNFLGSIPLAFGVVINIISDRAFKKYNTTVKPFEESTTLITSGVFRISRHPMYLGMVLILIGVAVLMRSLTPFLVIPVFALLMELVFIKIEERMLQEKFGKAWLEYKQKVRRWI